MGFSSAAAGEGAKSAGEAGAAKGAGAAAADAGGGLAADTAGSLAGFDAAAAGPALGDLGAGVTLDSSIGAGLGGAAGGAGALTSSLAADTAGSLSGLSSALGPTAADTASLGSSIGSLSVPSAEGLGGAGALTSAIPEMTVTAPAGGSGGGILPALGAAASPLAAGAQGGGGGAGTAQPQNFLPATGAGLGDLAELPPNVASQFGVASTPGSVGDLGAGDLGITEDASGIPVGADATAADSGNFGSDLMKWFSSPKNLATTGLLGNSLLTALNPPKLPSAANTALGAAGPAVQSAESIIQSGGTATPIWSQQKSSIDTTIDQQIKQQSEALMQAAANSGQGDQNSGIVQQQIAQMTSNLNVQRQQLYEQAQQQNVSNAVSELTGANQVLSSIAGIQLAQQGEARQAAGQSAQLALMLQSLGK